MFEPTKEEISLFEQIAERYRKEIKTGDYVIWAGRNCLVIESGKNYRYIAVKWIKGREQRCVKYRWIEQKYVLPFWTIKDCLEFLRKRGWWARIDFGIEDTRIYTFHKDLPSKNWNEYPMYKSKTPLEACLKAVLAVLKEKKQ